MNLGTRDAGRGTRNGGIPASAGAVGGSAEQSLQLLLSPASGFSASRVPRPESWPLQLIYGGTFDPVHNGHLAIARAARDAFGVPVRLMPAADPPHRHAPGANARQRCRMLALAIAGEPGLLLDQHELQRALAQPGVASYSIDTVRELRAELGAAAPLALLIGADSFVGFTGWRDWRGLLDAAHLVIADRAGSGWERALPPELAQAVAARWATSPQALGTAPGGLLWCLRQPLRTESASQVRECIGAGGDWAPLLPAAVADYIRAAGLYAPAARGAS
ncbi:nicotinate-nucleotide adenylyltransferase [Xanthomonas theicola]|uniref:Probable nicotinate-nucleotide adenylyltransferase n=1 Tax=Xanthomonas theicola TaxID=56464 RepID=A0A2S6ZBI8_9XANT|nr:nicotinate-nucleotide adenylyltransferase [Xanthomonas theicola]PPT82081.1 nicotinic acid mononucleotide adenylyltransferase [Xanthomonas theicola]QNH24076.1 nicotinate-nucleotide adenylyltransferase [Xanthomonas theicola]